MIRPVPSPSHFCFPSPGLGNDHPSNRRPPIIKTGFQTQGSDSRKASSDRYISTDIPAYSDTLGTKQKCHYKRGVTVRGGFVIVMNDLGPAQSVTISGVSL